MNFFILLYLFIFVCPFNLYAGSVKEDYELQERCGKRAEEVFKKEFGTGSSKNINDIKLSKYINHYNKKLMKCFIQVTESGITKTENIKIFITVKHLYDVNENKQYGTFIKNDVVKKPTCEVLEKKCNSEAEWDALVKPYMED